MRKNRERIQTKLNSMASILLDDIIKPDEIVQEGQESIVASLYDQNGNKLTFNLSLTVTPKEVEEIEPAPTLSDQISTILSEITSLKLNVAKLEGYHTQSEDEPSVPDEPTEPNTPNEDQVDDDL